MIKMEKLLIQYFGTKTDHVIFIDQSNISEQGHRAWQMALTSLFLQIMQLEIICMALKGLLILLIIVY